MEEKFRKHIEEGYTFKNDSILLGTTILDGKALINNQIKAPLQTFNRHGLIAGATGTGKTKTLQNIAERLSEKGVPTLLMDIKGDLSGLAAEGEMNSHIEERHAAIGSDWKANLVRSDALHDRWAQKQNETYRRNLKRVTLRIH